MLLKRTLSRAKWASLVILTLGVSLTELDAHKAKPARAGDTAQSPMLGFICVLMACLTSGFAGVWFEKILKGVGSGGGSSSASSSTSGSAAAGSGEAGAAGSGGSSSQGASVGAGAAALSSSSPAAPKSMWIRNIQMGLTSVVLALLAVYSKDRAVVAEKGFFYGYNSSVVGVILLQALGGLVVAAVVKYADNILKGFGSSISIVISCTLEWLFFDFTPTLRFLLGAGLVNAALYVYQDDRLVDRLVAAMAAGTHGPVASHGQLKGGGAGAAGEDGLPLLPLHHGHHHHHKDSSDEMEMGGGGLGGKLLPAGAPVHGIAIAPATKVYEGVGTLTARSSISSNAAVTSPTGSALFGGNSKSRDLKSLV